MNTDKLLLILIAIVLISIVISIIKKTVKFVIFVVALLFAFIVIRGVISGKTPGEVFNSTKADAIYAKELYGYTQKVKKSVENSLDAIDSKSLDKLKEENKKLHEYFDEVSKLYDDGDLKSIHEKYCGYLENIVKSSDAIVSSGNLTENTLSNLDKVKGNLNKYLDELVKVDVKAK